ncbi:MAG: hypothetical protein EP332_04255 [Bacteroidetes bacterium]|nr:MAG: hypothetical protein EP332_04255 [Bacteroidota bacterium]
MKQKLIAFVLILSLGLSSVTAGNDTHVQTLTVSGIVQDENGETLAGVAIKIAGTAEVVYTDIEGHYEISVPKTGKISITYSSISYKDKEVVLDANKTQTSDNLTVKLEKNGIL